MSTVYLRIYLWSQASAFAWQMESAQCSAPVNGRVARLFKCLILTTINSHPHRRGSISLSRGIPPLNHLSSHSSQQQSAVVVDSMLGWLISISLPIKRVAKVWPISGTNLEIRRFPSNQSKWSDLNRDINRDK